MAASNQLPRVLGITRGLKLPRWLERHGYAIGVGAFLAIVASRRELFDENATAAALLVAAVLLGALAGGLAFRGKSGFCGSVCPLRGVQGLYGQAPLLEIENSHCRPCVGCTSNCPDLKPRTHFAHDLRDEDGSRGRYRRLFAGLFPGFVLAFYTMGGPALLVFPLASLGLFFLFESVARARVEQVAAAFAAAAFATFYWFNVPILAAGIGRLAGGPAPEWAVWEGRVLAILLAGGWLVARLRANTAAKPAAAPLIPLPMVGDAPQPEPVEVPKPVVRAQPVAGDPPVPVPDRRSRGRPMRRPAVTVMPEGDRFEVAPGTTLLEVAQQAGVEVQAGCRMGLCGCDPVQVLGGAESLSPPSEDEQATIERLGFDSPTRLACCTRVLGDAVISLEPLLAAGSSRREAPAAAAVGSANGSANGAEPQVPELKINPRSHDVRRVVIVGNGIAGVTAADHIRRHHAECEVELVTDERHPFYNRTGISRLISSRGGIHKMYLLPDSWYEERRITPWLNTRVSRIDRDAHQAVLGTGDVLPYDRLILATGSSPFVPPIEGFGLNGSFCLRGADDAMLIRSFAQSEGARRAIVAGGGVLGLEAADELHRLGLEVAVVERAEWLAPAQIDQRGGQILSKHIQRRGIETLLGTTVESISGSERLETVRLSDGTTREADLLVVCAGVVPNAKLAADAGLEVGRGVIVDDRMQTSDKRIFAAGDVAEHAGRTYGVWPAAVEQAEIAAINVLGAEKTYSGSTVPTRLKLTGLDLISIGRPHADREGDVDIGMADPDGERYRKLVVADGGRIAGGVLLGHPEHADAVLSASREERDLRGQIEALKRGHWDVLSESSFERAAMAPLTRHNGQTSVPAAEVG